MKEKLKNEKGSVALFVLLTCLFFLIVVTSVGVSIRNKETSFNTQYEKIKSGYEKDVGNEVQVYEEAFMPKAIFKPGATVNIKMKQLAGIENAKSETVDTNIKEIKRATSISAENRVESNVVSISESNTPIYMWFENRTIYWYTKDEKPELNKDSSNMFRGCKGITNLDVSNFDTSNVTSMSYMFGSCSGLTSLDLSNFDTSNVVNMKGIFFECSILTSLDLRNFKTSKVEDMTWMFGRCSKIIELNLISFNTSNVINMGYMFNGCNSLEKLDLSGFDTRKVRSMEAMFTRCSSLEELDISSFDTSKIKSMYCMFQECSKLT